MQVKVQNLSQMCSEQKMFSAKQQILMKKTVDKKVKKICGNIIICPMNNTSVKGRMSHCFSHYSGYLMHDFQHRHFRGGDLRLLATMDL